MFYLFLADLVVIVHLSFVAFVVAGGLLALKWKRYAYVHISAVAWAVAVEMMGWVCPLTPLEIWFREGADGKGYTTGFVEHYILPVLYPAELTRTVQLILGILLLSFNIAIYSWTVSRLMKKHTKR